MVESVRKRWILDLVAATTGNQVAGASATCYYHGDTTQRGIVQILIQGSIFIDSNATMQSECQGVDIRAQLYVDLPFPCPNPTILWGRCLWQVADPSSSGNSLSGWEWEGKMGAAGGPWGLFPPNLRHCGQSAECLHRLFGTRRTSWLPDDRLTE